MAGSNNGPGHNYLSRRAVIKHLLPQEMKPLLTLKEASLYTGIGINKLRDMSNERNCNYVLFVGRKRMFKRESLLKFLAESYSV